MSVAFATEYARRMRARGFVIHEHPDWARRGNGQTSNYQGGVIHHTGSDYDKGFAILVTGRPDLGPPLCNVAGWSDGSGTLIAAHPANHAGASGGRAMGPLPTTRLFNRLTFALEIIYPGSKPMTAAQRRFALAHAAVVAELTGGTTEYIRGHAETSITGKWDPGHAPGKTIDLAAFRREAALLLHHQEADMDKDQDDRLRAVEAGVKLILQQLSGSMELGEYPGWPAREDLSGDPKTLVNYARADYAETTKRIGRRPLGGPDEDTVLGHSASAHGVARTILTRLDKLAADVAAWKGARP